MSTDEGRYVYEVENRLKLLYSGLKGYDTANEREWDTEFMRDVNACVSLFYEVVGNGQGLEWARREQLKQEAAELYIDNAVREMVDKYYKVRTSRDQYSTRAQTEFGILAGWVKAWKREPPADTQQRRLTVLVERMKALIFEMQREVRGTQ
jgi:hypothetical protein